MKFLMTMLIATGFCAGAFAKIEKKKLDLTTISKPAPAPKVDSEPTLTEPQMASETAPETTAELAAPANANLREGYTPIDIKQLKDVNKPIKTNTLATVKCRAPTGVQYLPTDSGFENCLKQNEINKARAANREGDPSRNGDQTPGQSVDFSFGESH